MKTIKNFLLLAIIVFILYIIGLFAITDTIRPIGDSIGLKGFNDSLLQSKNKLDELSTGESPLDTIGETYTGAIETANEVQKNINKNINTTKETIDSVRSNIQTTKEKIDNTTKQFNETKDQIEKTAEDFQKIGENISDVTNTVNNLTQ